ncbi:MAG: NADH-quinone oxidoreductase subunit NuoN [Campylobacteraceae bacterium]|nr:NADH-quinone oxidoreductase subunit NuoN [Campylobacteraceae bacterium]
MIGEIQTINIDFLSLNLSSIAPMAIAVIGALFIICLDLFSKKYDKSLYVILTVLFLLIDLFAVLGFDGNARGMFDLVLIDGIAILAQIMIIISAIFFILLSLNKLRFHELEYPEYFALYLFMIAGFQFMVSSDSLILIFLGLETASMSLYTLIAMHNKKSSIEAAIKYFTQGALATAFFAFASMIFYALSGSVEIDQIVDAIVANDFANYPFILLGLVFMLGALAFKLSLVPFHFWVPDVYEGASTSLAGFISIVPKIAAFVVTIRFFEIFLASREPFLESILYIIVVLSITIPNLLALIQKDLLRMLAYSSISSAGFATAAILIGTQQATTGLFLYWILFFIVNLGAFAVIWANANKDKIFDSANSFDRYKGLIKTSPFTAITLGLFMLSLAGLPPFAIFWGKLYLIGSAVNSGMMTLAIIMALNSALAAYYYLKPIVYMFLREAVRSGNLKHKQNQTKVIKTIIIICSILSVLSIFSIEPLIKIIELYLY